MILRDKYLDKIYHRYGVDLYDLMNKDIEVPREILKTTLKTYIYICIDSLSYKDLDLKDFPSICGGVDVVKLGNWLHRQLVDELGDDVYMCVLDKLKYYVKDKKIYKKMKWLIK